MTVTQLLPTEILSRATLREKEYAWPLDDIPAVIEAGRQANLINIGGQLQFRIPDRATCEVFDVQVDTYKSIPKSLPHDERVEQTAAVALQDYQRIRAEIDFFDEGYLSFPNQLEAYEAEGGNLNDVVCFVWYLTAD